MTILYSILTVVASWCLLWCLVCLTSSMVTALSYKDYTGEAEYVVVNVTDMITVEYAIDGISHTCVVKPMLSSYQTGDKGVLRYEEIDNPILDKEADDSYRYFKVGLAITVVCALLLLCSTHGWI